MRRERRKLAVWVALRFGKYISELPERIKGRRNLSLYYWPSKRIFACSRPLVKTISVRVWRKISICCLLFAWLCANGAVCSVGCCAKRSCGNSPASAACQSLKGGCECCGDRCNHGQGCLTEAEPTQAPQTNKDAVVESIESFVLHLEGAPDHGWMAPRGSWPDVAHAAGLTRTELVPVPPPRV